MKLKTFICTSIFSCALSFGILLGAGPALKAKAVLASEPLDIPSLLPEIQNVQINSEGLVTWDTYTGWLPTGVAWGFYFDVDLDGTDVDHNRLENDVTSFDFKEYLIKDHRETGTYKAKLYAFACDGDDFYDYDYDYTFTQEANIEYSYTNTQTPIATPTNVYWDNTTLHWDKVEEARAYSINLYEKDGYKRVYGTSTSSNEEDHILFNTRIEADKEYFAKVTALVKKSDLTHKNSIPAVSGTLKINATGEFKNLAINEAGEISFDTLENVGYYHIRLLLHSGEARLERGVPNFTTMPIKLGEYLTEHETDSLPANGVYDIQILACKADHAPITKRFFIEGWTLGNTYTQPEEPVTPTQTDDPVTPPSTDESTTPSESESAKKGLSGGAIAGIVIGSVAVAGLGTFAVVWFAVLKKSWADLGLVFKKIPGLFKKKQ